jgi:hypothetical protein
MIKLLKAILALLIYLTMPIWVMVAVVVEWVKERR